MFLFCPFPLHSFLFFLIYLSYGNLDVAVVSLIV